MIFVTIGIILGILSGSVVGFIGEPIDAFLKEVIAAIDLHTLNWVNDPLNASEYSSLVLVLVILLQALLPGLLVLLTAYLLKNKDTINNILGALFITIAVGSFFLLPFLAALFFLLIVGFIIAVARLGSGVFFKLPLAFIATIVSVRHVNALLSDGYLPVLEGSLRLAEIAGTVELWKWLLVLVALAPIAGSFALLFFSEKTSKK